MRYIAILLIVTSCAAFDPSYNLKPLLDRGFKIDESMTYKLSDTETNYVLRR